MKHSIAAFFIALAFTSCNKKETVQVKKKSIVEAVYASGFVVPKNEYKLYAIGDGYMVQQYKKAGDEVKAGEAVFQIQSENQIARLDAANSAYRIARQNTQNTSPILQELQNTIKNAQLKFTNDSLSFVRAKNMFTQGVITQTEFDKTTLAFNVSKNDLLSAQERFLKTKDQLDVEAKNAQSNLQTATTDLNNYTLRSFMNGIVYETYKELGELVRKNDMVALIGDKREKVLQLSVDQQDIGKVKTGQLVLVKMDISGNKTYNARIEKIYPAMNQNEQSFRVDAVFENTEDVNFVKTSVEANIIIAQKDNVPVIPRKVLIDETKVILKDGKEVAVKTGIGNMEDVEVIEGLKENDEVQIPVVK
ncbi:MAG: HlyD family efflux transporter periplasmic adaptor subunit [Chitinophagales bacterium]|nr:HlyD family efflux transporter periplasmic adaptor subunit [Chitinophagales bacterium]